MLPIKRLAQAMNQAQVITFIGGAGTSTASGIPDYRSKQGIWTRLKAEDKDPQYFANYQRIDEDPKRFFQLRRAANEAPAPEPNIVHKTLAALEQQYKDVRVITQNVDGLHRLAGQRALVEIHGSAQRWYCTQCHRPYQTNELQRDEQYVPRCPYDQGVVRPDIVYFGENVKAIDAQLAHDMIAACDVLIVAGTTLSTGFPRELVRQFHAQNQAREKERQLFFLNNEPTRWPRLAPTCYIEGNLTDTFQSLVPLLKTPSGHSLQLND
ncbi:MAG: Sir2 family NAD-dependent protein deacetylase [Aerococcus sp.]|nr:Sir2 family NAD-dependent protein deacetylase [Aerococcus sp.]